MKKQKWIKTIGEYSLYKNTNDDQHYLVFEDQYDYLIKMEIKYTNKVIPDDILIVSFKVGKVNEDARYEYWDITEQNPVKCKLNTLQGLAIWRRRI